MRDVGSFVLPRPTPDQISNMRSIAALASAVKSDSEAKTAPTGAPTPAVTNVTHNATEAVMSRMIWSANEIFLKIF